MPSTRFRVLQYLPLLAEQEVYADVLESASPSAFVALKKIRSLFLYVRTLWACRHYDLVFLQKPGFIANRWIPLRLLFKLNRRVVFDFDDALFIDPETGNMMTRPGLEKLEFILQRSVAVIAGNSYLADFAKKYNPQVEIIPTSVDSEHYSPIKERPVGRPVTIGWMGTTPNLAYLFHLIPVMKCILARTDAVFLIITNLDKKPSGLDFSDRIEFRAWQAKTEVDDLRCFDIGIMPLPDNLFTRGKCAFKLLQYMAVAVPVVASPVGVNTRVVEDGVNGFLACDEEKWLEKLEILCRDEPLRRRLGAAGREMVVREYSLRRWAGFWVNLLMREAGGYRFKTPGDV